MDAKAVEKHYGRGAILESIARALGEMGKDMDRLKPADLAPVDEFHTRGREATIELSDRAGIGPGLRVLDVGCGLGGSARYLASEWGCVATGIDLTAEYVEAANTLAGWVGLAEVTTFRQGSALELPFEEASFDVVWTEHAQMNIADKRAFYAQIARVLAPGGRLAFHDIFQGDGGEPHFPVPWAEEGSISFLARPEVVRDILAELGFRILDWEDKTRHSLEWFRAALARLKGSGPAPLGLHLLTGATALVKFENLVRSLEEGRIEVVQAAMEKDVELE